MTLRLELDEDLARLLEAEAQTLHISPQQLALQKLRVAMESPTDVADDEEFEVVARRAIARDDELLRRLAQ